ncbi:MAG: hypothetical protein WC497_05225 [Patescibacteria group bacterium]
MGRKLKALAALGSIAAAHKCEEDGHNGSAALFYAIGLGNALSLARELEEEEAAEQAEIERQEEKDRQAARWQWERDHVCIDCRQEFDELYSDGRCYSCWGTYDMNMDYDD